MKISFKKKITQLNGFLTEENQIDGVIEMILTFTFTNILNVQKQK